MTGRARKRRAACVALAAAALGLVWSPQAGALDTDGVQVPVEFRSGRVLLVRPNRIDVVDGGRVIRVIPVARAVDLGRLPDLVQDRRFASRAGERVVRLHATIAQRPGSRLVGSKASLGRLQIVASGAAPRIVGTRAGLTLDGVVVESVTPKGKPATPSPRRASVRYTHGSEVSIERSRLQNLGSTGLDGRPALEVGGGSTLRLIRTRITGGTTGLRLDGAAGAVLDGVTVRRSAGDGVVVNGGAKLSVAALGTRDNAGAGLLLRGPVGTVRVSGPVTASGNRGVGVRVSDMHGATLRRISTSRNGDGGISVRGGETLTLTDLRSSGDVTGVSVRGSSGVRLRGVTADRVASGLVVKESSRITVEGVRVSAARDEGVGVSGQQITLHDVRVRQSGEGLVVGNHSRDVAVSDGTLEGERAGVRAAPGSADVSLRHVVARSPGAVAIRSSASGTTLADVNAVGAVGMDLQARTTVVDGVVTATGQALRAGPMARVAVNHSRLTADVLGISASSGSTVTVQNTRVVAQRATDGRVSFGTGNDISRLPIRWVAIVGLTAMTLAISLEVLRKLREHGERRGVHAPVHVLNRT